MSKNQKLFYQQTNDEIVAELGVDPATGLSAKEPEARRGQYGPNSLPEGKKTSPLTLFLSQFKDVLIVVLIIAATISLVLAFVE
jgi:Ca2+-transporting ATPase